MVFFFSRISSSLTEKLLLYKVIKDMNELVAVSAAIPLELHSFEKSFSSKRREGEYIFGELQGNQLALVTTGVGPEIAEENLSAFFSRFQPRFIIFMGFAGGLSPEIPLGELFLVDEGYQPSSKAGLEPAFTTEGTLIQLAKKALNNQDIPFRLGASVTLAHPLLSSEEKLSLGRRFAGISLVDMEDAALARAAASFNIPYLIIRIISDPAEEDLKPVLTRFSSRKGLSRALILLNPVSACYLLSLWYRCIRLSSHLFLAVSAIIPFL
jgi:adenosylhomocysteine nucleosidase